MDKASPVEVWQDITDHFSFVNEHLVYTDAPWEGFLRSSATGELFAFRTSEIIAGLLWHWSLLPVSSVEETVGQVFSAAQTDPPQKWISIVEDRRGTEPQLSAARLTGGFRSG